MVVQQENDRQGMLQCQAVSSDLGVSLMGLTRSRGQSKRMERRGGEMQGCLPKSKMHGDTDDMYEVHTLYVGTVMGNYMEALEKGRKGKKERKKGWRSGSRSMYLGSAILVVAWRPKRTGFQWSQSSFSSKVRVIWGGGRGHAGEAPNPM